MAAADITEDTVVTAPMGILIDKLVLPVSKPKAGNGRKSC